MSDCDCEHDGEEEEEQDEQQKFEMSMMAGWFEVQAEGETPEDAREQLEELWDKGLEDIKGMDQEQREDLYLQ